MARIKAVYTIRHTPSGRVYIGSSTQLQQRYKDHVWALNKGTHENPALQSDWSRDGASAFRWGILEVVECWGFDAIEFAEQRWIDCFVARGVVLYNRKLNFRRLISPASSSRTPPAQQHP